MTQRVQRFGLVLGSVLLLLAIASGLILRNLPGGTPRAEAHARAGARPTTQEPEIELVLPVEGDDEPQPLAVPPAEPPTPFTPPVEVPENAAAETTVESASPPAFEEPTPSPPAESLVVALAPEQPKPKEPKLDLTDELFGKGLIPNIKLSINNKEEQKLRSDPRHYADCTLLEDGNVVSRKVGVKLKGAAGSFRNYDDRPALTISMKKKDERFHGLEKFHLNNSVQDESLLCELLASQICREAGCPTPRTTHARLWLNNRDMGVYVLKEGFDPGFLKRNFGNGKGNLYDGGFIRDIDQDLEKDEGEGVDDNSDLKALVAACREGDANKRWALIAERLDVDAFLNFMALELMMCHWDGYVQNRNNYRIYFRPSDGKAVFMPHGMDQMFVDPNYSCLHHPGPIVPQALLHNLEWRAKYRQRVKDLLPMFAAGKLNAKIDAAHQRLRPVLAKISEDRARHHDGRVQDLKNRVAQRAGSIKAQLRSGPPEPLVFGPGGAAKVEDWEPKPEGDTKLEEQEIEGKVVYVFQTGPSNRAQASYRRRVTLGKGNYRLEVLAKAKDVKPVQDDKGGGLGLRLSGGKRENQLVGTTDWQKLSHAFEVPEERRDVDLVAEFRALGGSALIDVGSITLVKVN
jgi:hypothetical protein